MVQSLHSAVEPTDDRVPTGLPVLLGQVQSSIKGFIANFLNTRWSCANKDAPIIAPDCDHLVNHKTFFVTLYH